MTTPEQVRATIRDAYFTSYAGKGGGLTPFLDDAVERILTLIRPQLADPQTHPPGPDAFHDNGPETEREAYLYMLPRAGTLREQALDQFYAHPDGLTDRELAEATGVYLYSIAPRRTELVRMGWVEDSGRRKPQGRVTAVVWVLTVEGRARWGQRVA